MIHPAVFPVVAALGFWAGVEWQQGREAIALADARRGYDAQTANMNKVALAFAETSAKLNTQLGDARARIRNLTTGRDCLSADAVRVLNAAADVPAAAGEPAGTAAAAATDRDVGDALAQCRIGYRKLADQLNSILDIEESRQ